MTDQSKNVPFSIRDEEDDSDVFSSVEVNRSADESGVSGGNQPKPQPKTQPKHQLKPQLAPGTAPARASGPIQAPGARSTGASQAVRSTGPAPTVRNSGALKAPAAAPRSTPMPRLTIETVGQPGSRSADVTSRVFTIGSKGSDLVVQDNYVAPMHALIRIDDGGVAELLDMGSRNGVFLRIADDLALEDWDEIAVGTQRFVFRTSWDTPREARNPNKGGTIDIGGNPPSDAARLIQMYSGGQIGGIWRVSERVSIGRNNADVSEPQDPWLSDPHATIERRGTKFFIKDAQSQHGTFIRLLDSVELIEGDVFMVGRTRIKLGYP